MMSLPVTVVLAALGVLALIAASVKWSLPARSVAWIIALATLAGICTVALPAFLPWWGRPFLMPLAQGSTFLFVVLWLFYRDPDRRVPPDPRVIVSPADGVVIYVRRLEAGEPIRSEKNRASMRLVELEGTGLAQQALWQIGISMVFTDVHVNRSPVAGTVTLVHHRPGRFLSLRHEDALGVNERQTLVVDNGSFQIGLVQIASRLVRQIVAYVSPGESLVRGQRVGMIRFGSQVDLFVPVAVVNRLEVAIGQRTVAGETIVGRTSV